MARKDISINPVHGELNMTDGLSDKKVCKFVSFGAIEGIDNDTYIYGEIVVPSDFELAYNDVLSIHVHIPYIPEYKQLMVRFRLDNNSNEPEYAINRMDNQIWHKVSSENGPVAVSEFVKYNSEFVFHLVANNGKLTIYSGAETDIFIKASIKQNEIFLLKSFPSNLYQYPSTGVGLVDYIHSNLAGSNLSSKLEKEFNNDKVTVNNATANTKTGELYLDIEEQNG